MRETTDTNSVNKQKIIAVSGAFDPLHPGHIAMFEAAASYGELHIILNSDDWLARKKGFYFQPFDDRKKILEAFTPYVHTVHDADGSVCAALQELKPDYFGNGGDRTVKNTPEQDLCESLGIEMIFNLGGGKYNSSTAVNGRNRVLTRWGRYDVILDMPNLKVKMLHVDPGKELSLQRHTTRSEFFFMPNGEVRVNLPGVWHVLKAPDDRVLSVLEVQIGVSEEEDEEQIMETAAEFASEVAQKIELNTQEHPEVAYQYR